MKIRHAYHLALLALLVGVGSGCGGGREIPEPVASTDVVYANAVRSSIDDIRTAESPVAAVQNAQYALEDMEGYEEWDGVAEHSDTYREIYQKFEEIRRMQNPSQDEIGAKVEELETLAAKLPKMEAAESPAATVE